MASSQSTYRDWAPQADGLPIFSQPWWLDAVCGPQGWGVVLARDKGGRIVGALPFARSRKYGLVDVVHHPPLTPYLGPHLVFPQGQKRVSRYHHAKSVTEDLLARLPRVAFTYIKAAPDLLYPLPFHWAGFALRMRFTYRLAPGQEARIALERAKGSVRTELRQAAQTVSCRQVHALRPFLPLLAEVYRRQGMPMPYDRKLLPRLFEAAARRQQAACWMAEDPSGRALAGALVVWDARYAYLLVTGRRQDCPSHALTAAIWRAIEEALGRGHGFDFEGSMLPGVEHHFRAFGGKLTAYPQCFRAGNRFWELVAYLRGRH